MGANDRKLRGPEEIDGLGRSALHYSAAAGDLLTVQALIRSGASPRIQDRAGWTPLHFAAQARSGEICRELILAGAELDARDVHGNTPLMRAVFSSQGRGSAVLALREAGADPYLANHSGVTPLALARKIANYDIAQFFGELPTEE